MFSSKENFIACVCVFVIAIFMSSRNITPEIQKNIKQEKKIEKYIKKSASKV